MCVVFTLVSAGPRAKKSFTAALKYWLNFINFFSPKKASWIGCLRIALSFWQIMMKYQVRFQHHRSRPCPQPPSSTPLESKSTTIKSIKIRVCHFKVEAVKVRGVEWGAAGVVHSCWSHAREIRVEWKVRSFGFQIRERACAYVTHSRGSSSPSHQQINCPHCLGITNSAMTQTPYCMCSSFVILWTGRISACWIEWFERNTQTCCYWHKSNKTLQNMCSARAKLFTPTNKRTP